MFARYSRRSGRCATRTRLCIACVGGGFCTTWCATWWGHSWMWVEGGWRRRRLPKFWGLAIAGLPERLRRRGDCFWWGWSMRDGCWPYGRWALRGLAVQALGFAWTSRWSVLAARALGFAGTSHWSVLAARA